MCCWPQGKQPWKRVQSLSLSSVSQPLVDRPTSSNTHLCPVPRPSRTWSDTFYKDLLLWKRFVVLENLGDDLSLECFYILSVSQWWHERLVSCCGDLRLSGRWGTLQGFSVVNALRGPTPLRGHSSFTEHVFCQALVASASHAFEPLKKKMLFIHS